MWMTAKRERRRPRAFTKTVVPPSLRLAPIGSSEIGLEVRLANVTQDRPRGPLSLNAEHHTGEIHDSGIT